MDIVRIVTSKNVCSLYLLRSVKSSVPWSRSSDAHVHRTVASFGPISASLCLPNGWEQACACLASTECRTGCFLNVSRCGLGLHVAEKNKLLPQTEAKPMRNGLAVISCRSKISGTIHCVKWSGRRVTALHIIANRECTGESLAVCATASV